MTTTDIVKGFRISSDPTGRSEMKHPSRHTALQKTKRRTVFMIQVPFPKPPTVSCILQHLTRKNTDIRENKNHCSAIFRHPDGPFVYWLNSSPTQKSNLHTFCVHLVFWACLPDVLTRAHLAQDPSTRHGARNAHQWLR